MILDYRNYIVEKASEGLVNYTTVDDNQALFNHNSICPFCKTEISNQIHYKSKHESPDWPYGTFEQSEAVIQCPVCGWWEYKYWNQSDAIIDGIRATDIEYASAILRKYEDSAVDVPISVLRTYLEKKPDIIYNIDAHKMEDLVRSVFSDFYPKCKVYSFGKTRDGGKDGVFVDGDGQQIILQVKRRTKADATEGVVPVRELMGVATLEDNLKGCVFVSTADHFSKDAKDFAARAIQKKRVEIFDLIDCKEFLKCLELTNKNMPDVWESLLRLK